MIVQDIYARVCGRFLEPYPPGLQSGIFTLDDFLQHFSGVISDFFERTGISQVVATGAVHLGISVCQVPDQISHVENVFVAGRLMRRETLQTLNDGIYQWRRQTGIPRAYHEDGLPVKQVEIFPTPNYEGTAVPNAGPGVITPPETDEPMQLGDFLPRSRGYTLVGSQVPLNDDLTPKTSWALADAITGIPSSAATYLSWGVLGKMFSDDSEAKDEVRASYCNSRYDEGVSIFREIAAEKLLQEPDSAL